MEVPVEGNLVIRSGDKTVLLCCCSGTGTGEPYEPYPYPYPYPDPYPYAMNTLSFGVFSLDNPSQVYMPLPFLANLITEDELNSRENLLLDPELELDETSRYQILGSSEWF